MECEKWNGKKSIWTVDKEKKIQEVLGATSAQINDKFTTSYNKA